MRSEVGEAELDYGYPRFPISTLSKIRHLTFPGGILRTPVLTIGMSWFKFKDWLKI